MANKKHLEIIEKGVVAWNEWRQNNPDLKPDLSDSILSESNLSGVDFSDACLSCASLNEANLSNANLCGADLQETEFFEANLCGANLSGAEIACSSIEQADLSKANLSNANLGGADLTWANLSEADLRGAYLGGVNLFAANLSKADLRGADLNSAIMVRTNLEKADLTGCRIYGISAWDLKLKETKQFDLIITPGDTEITVDNLEVAQFVYLLLNNEKLRDVIDTITSKVVLILGRFTPERKVVLDALKEELRKRNYLPILFDFEKPNSKNTTETITLLAGMARFVIADITDAKSIPQELQAIVPHLPSVPVQPLLEYSQKEYGMFESFSDYPWVLKTYYYNSISEVRASINEKVISPAETKVREILEKRTSLYHEKVN